MLTNECKKEIYLNINMYKKTTLLIHALLLIIISLYTLEAKAQTFSNNLWVEGFIKDSQSKEPLIGATLTIAENPRLGTATDLQGHYRLRLLETGTYTFICRSIGYKEQQIKLTLETSTTKDFLLESASESLQEVVITGERINPLTSAQMGVSQLSSKEITKLPAFLGEHDIMKTLQLMPGVKSENDGSSGFQVRGGESTQNLILLDGSPINHAGHLLGIFSAFNADALRYATLYKGQVPAQYGDRIASVLDLKTKDGNASEYAGNAKIGLLAAGFHLNGPIEKGKSSFALSARRTYADLFLKASPKLKNNTLNFFDINLKAMRRFSKRDNLFFTGFLGQDNIGINNLADMKWNNRAASLRWVHLLNSIWAINTSFNYSNYTSHNVIDILLTRYAYNSSIQQISGQTELQYHLDNGLSLRMGVSSMLNRAVSADWDEFDVKEKEKRKGMQHNGWIQSNFNLTEQFNISAGLRASAFSALGGSPFYTLNEKHEIATTTFPSSSEIVKTYWSLEPRLGMSYQLTPLHTLKTSYNRMSQNVHTIKNPVTTAPFERYIISSNLIKPQQADQLSLGYAGSTATGDYEWTAEGYYKWMNNQLDYLDGKGFFTAVELEPLLASGIGKAYGWEFNFKKNTGLWTGWISYTLAWSKRKMDAINNGKWYNANNDRRHDINTVVMYHLNKRWDFSANFVFTTGQALNAPSSKLIVDGETQYYYGFRNAYRSPIYHRLDLSATYKQKPRKYYQGEWNFALYNAYSHYNPYVISIESDQDKTSGTSVKQFSLYGLIPSVSYKISF